MTARLAENRR